MSKVKVVGNQYGIEITKPWSDEMYSHNDKVADLMKDRISDSLKISYLLGMPNNLRDMAYHIRGYRIGQCDVDEVYEIACSELQNMQNFWLHEQWEYMVAANLVTDIDEKFVGYDK